MVFAGWSYYVGVGAGQIVVESGEVFVAAADFCLELGDSNAVGEVVGGGEERLLLGNYAVIDEDRDLARRNI